MTGLVGSLESSETTCSLTVVIPPITGVSCLQIGSGVQLDWTNGDTYDSIDIVRDGVVIDTLPGTATTYVDVGPAPGGYTYQVVGHDRIDTAKAIGQLGLHAERVEQPGEVRAAIERALAANDEGHPAYIEMNKVGAGVITDPATLE